MKYTVLELRKSKLPLTEESNLDLSEDLNGFEDILSSSECNVVETLTKHDSFYQVDAKIKIQLVLESSISLKEVPYDIETEATFLFTDNKEDANENDAILIENGTIDTKDAILTEILCNKPMTVCLPGEVYNSDDSEEDSINPAFASLADLLKN